MLIRSGKLNTANACLVDIKRALELKHNYILFVDNTIL